MQYAITAAGAALLQVRLPRLAVLWGAWVEAERGRFVPWLAVAAITGVGLYFAQLAEPPVWAGVAAVLASLLACILG